MEVRRCSGGRATRPLALACATAAACACAWAGCGSDAPSNPDAAAAVDATPRVPRLVVPRESLAPADVAVLVNADDPQSVAVGAHYLTARGIPEANLISLSLGASYAATQTTTISADTFAAWKAQLDAATPAAIQAYAVTWLYPSVVDCMSLTSALAFGFDRRWCTQPAPCAATAPSPYFAADGSTPFTTYHLRPAMMLAGTSADAADALIDRGVAADATYPLATGYLVRTSDAARSVRYPDFAATAAAWNRPDSLSVRFEDDSASGTGLVTGEPDVLFYFTGLASVDGIDTNHYLPGAIADHLTSFGGQIPTSGQMSILRWLEAGATASFGTVVEPCNYPTKFPQASVAIAHYFRGETLIEAYWKSVAWPGEGLFIGEPLARPYGTTYALADGTMTIRTTALVPDRSYELDSAPDEAGPRTAVMGDISVAAPSLKTLAFPATEPFYRLAPAP
ncbi:MAG TPA: TIGR03790 family protein [Kofleriaceae bacterium]|nr:TIGR03790 family protein [Kofleriaceae bacterium]